MMKSWMGVVNSGRTHWVFIWSNSAQGNFLAVDKSRRGQRPFRSDYNIYLVSYIYFKEEFRNINVIYHLNLYLN